MRVCSNAAPSCVPSRETGGACGDEATVALHECAPLTCGYAMPLFVVGYCCPGMMNVPVRGTPTWGAGGPNAAVDMGIGISCETMLASTTGTVFVAAANCGGGCWAAMDCGGGCWWMVTVGIAASASAWQTTRFGQCEY